MQSWILLASLALGRCAAVPLGTNGAGGKTQLDRRPSSPVEAEFVSVASGMWS